MSLRTSSKRTSVAVAVNDSDDDDDKDCCGVVCLPAAPRCTVYVVYVMIDGVTTY